MQTAGLPGWLRPRQRAGLIRLGRDCDGGYVVCRDDVATADLLLSLGLGNDWSFEKAFLAINPVALEVYDRSVDGRHYLQLWRTTVRAMLCGRASARAMLGAALRWLRYEMFFRRNRVHRTLFVDGSDASESVSMGAVLERIRARRIFLKMDIEGGEYEALDVLVAERERFTGLVIEFHDCEHRLPTIQRFVQALGMPVVHVHANNHSDIAAPGGIAEVIEVTFSREADAQAATGPYPTGLDRPNHPAREEIAIEFVDG